MRHRHARLYAHCDRIKDLLPRRPGQHGGVAQDHRLFIDAGLWIGQTGAEPRRVCGSAGSRPGKTPTSKG